VKAAIGKQVQGGRKSAANTMHGLPVGYITFVVSSAPALSLSGTLTPPGIDAQARFHGPNVVPPLLGYVESIAWEQVAVNGWG
jgi:hypothetical protein